MHIRRCLCRMAVRMKDLFDLNPHLVERILISLSYSIEEIAELRLVCKAWQAAIQFFPAWATLSSPDAALASAEKMPGSVSVTHRDVHAYLDVSALSQCSQLKSQNLGSSSPRRPRAKLLREPLVPHRSWLTLKHKLRESSLVLAPSGFDNTGAVLTHIHYHYMKDLSHFWNWRWLHNLQGLRVSCPNLSQPFLPKILISFKAMKGLINSCLVSLNIPRGDSLHSCHVICWLCICRCLSWKRTCQRQGHSIPNSDKSLNGNILA